MSNQDFSQLQALYQTGFSYNLNLSPQVTVSGLTDAVDYNRSYDKEGKYFNSDWMGQSDPEDINSRIPETIWKEIGKERRCGILRGFYDARVMEDIDDVREGATDPQSKFVAAMRAGRERKERRAIFDAIFGNGYRYNEDDTITAIALPAEQKIAANYAKLHEDENPTPVGGLYPMTLGKFLQANRKLDDANIPEEGRIFAVSGYQLQMMAMTKVGTNSLYMKNINAVIAGETNMIGNVKVKKIGGKGSSVAASGLPYDVPSLTEKCAIYHKDAIQFRARDIKKLRIAELPEKGFRPGVYYEVDQGAARMIDAAVMEIDCYRAND